MKRQLVIFFMIAFALVLIPRVSTATSVPAADARSFCTQFLEQVAGFHMNESIVFNYTMEPVKMPDTQGTPHFQSYLSFDISNDHGSSNALFKFVDGNFWAYNLYLLSGNLGGLEPSLNESSSMLISALSGYQALLNASYCEDFSRMVFTSLEKQELNVETSDSLLQIKQTNYNSTWLPTLEVSWFRKIDGQFTTNFQSIQVGMRNGLITEVLDSMSTYHVATTSVAVSYDEAMNISRPFIEAFAQENQLNTVSISATLNYTIDGIAQRGDSFAIYPFWLVKGIYDKTAQGYNADSYSVIIWADNGSISGEGPDAGGIGSGPSAAVNPLLFLVPAGFGIFVLGTCTYIRRKSKTQALWVGFDGMSAKWVSVFLSVGGLVLAVLGLLLPWTEWSARPGVVGGPGLVLGVNTYMGGFFSSIGVVISVVSWVLAMARKPKSLLTLSVGGGIWIMTCAWAWIVSPGTLFGAPLTSYVAYTASYGVYVSLVGGALTFAGAALGLCQSSLPPISPVPSFLRKRRMGILLFAVVLTVGLGLGMVSVAFLFPTHTEPSWKSAVLVSGTISQTQPHNGTIYFDSMDRDNTVGTKANITDGKYSVLLVGGLWYTVSFYSGDIHHPWYGYTLYVPSSITTFTANF